MGASPQGFESLRFRQIAAVAQVVEHILGKDEVTSSSLVSSSKTAFQKKRCFFIFLLRVGNKNIKARFLQKPCGAAGACATANKNTACFSLHPLVFISSTYSKYRKENVFGSRFFYILAYNAYKNIKARFLLKTVRSCRRHRTTIENTSCSHRLCLSSSAALTQSAVKQWFRWFAVFLYPCIQRMQEYKSTVFAKTVRSCWRHRTTIENASCSHRLCLSSSAVKRIDLIE